MDKEEAVRVVLLLDFGESQVVAAPIEMLEVRLKEGAFRDVRSSAGSNSAEFIHRAMHRAGSFAAFGNFGLMTGNTGIRGPWPSATNRESKGVLYCRIHGSIFCRFDGFRRSAREPLIEMALDFVVTRSRK